MRFTCHVATHGAGVALPARWLQQGASALESAFREGSQRPDGGTGVELQVRPPRALGDEHASASPNESALNRLLEDLGVAADTGPATQLGLIFTGRHPADQKAHDEHVEGPLIFGLLFDPGFYPNNPGLEDTFTRVPREGCAVFVQTIAERRKEVADFERELVFTAIHEMGHVFNLWHVEQKSLMFRSAKEPAALEEKLWRFTDKQEEFLRSCPESESVQPGGRRFGDRGTLYPHEKSLWNAAGTASGLRLRIDVQPREFWRFEPVELEVRLSVPRTRSRAVRVPHAIDPGHESFEIWIEEPDGTRRRYRPTAHYCAGGALRIAPGRPFERDIPLFGQSGGYTFRRAGVHRVQALFRLPGGRVLRSNPVEVSLRADGRDERYAALARTLTDPRTARLLFHRHAPRFGPWTRELHEFANGERRTHVGARLLYALGRAHLEAASRTRSSAPAARQHHAGAELLAQAAQLDGLGHHQRRMAERLRSGGAA